jgi:hypothetical protein
LAGGTDIIISEFLATNTRGLTDEDGDDSDWIELSNISPAAVNLAGWHLTDDALSLDQWTFPKVSINPGAKLIVFASGKDRAVNDAELHTNFKLSSAGEFLALVRPDGVTIEYEFAPSYPQQYPDISYGAGDDSGGSTIPLVGPESDVRFLVPADPSQDVGGVTPFNALGFNESAWISATLGVGYATQPGDPFDDYIGAGGDVEELLHGVNPSIYMRIPFTIDDPAEITSLAFRARYDDGFAIYINGSGALASANPPSDGVLNYEAEAGTDHDSTAALALEPFAVNLGDVDLVAGTNILAVHGMNHGVSASEFLFDCELDAQLTPAPDRFPLVYMIVATPGEENTDGSQSLGPVIRNVTENPDRPDVATQSELFITAEVTPSSDPITSVSLIHRQGFAAERILEMKDDGLAPDAIAGDGVFSAHLPLARLAPGEMVRWRIEAADRGNTTSRNPFFGDSLNAPEYFGTAATDPDVGSNLPVLEWFIQNPAAANTRSGTRASCLFLGEFYDNIFCRVRGGSSAGLSKKSYKFDFNTGHHFRFDSAPDSVRAEEFNLNTTWTDKAYVRQPLGYEFYDLAGSPGSVCFLARVQQNGAFFSVAAYTEQVDKRLLRREERIDDDGALYKMFNGGTSSSSGVEKKNRTHEDNSDLAAFLAGINTRGSTLERFIFDNVDLPRELNYLAATVLTQNNDNMRKNYYLYRDTEGAGEWTQLPWDLDLTWGSHYMTGDNISHDGIWATEDYVLGGRNANTSISPSHPFVGIQELPGNRSWNKIIDKLLENPRFKAMFQRRLRTLVDELLLSTVADESIDATVLALGNDAVLDRNKWGQFGQRQSLERAIATLKNDYLAPRRTHLSVTHQASNARSYRPPAGAPAAVTSALLPEPQIAMPQINFGTFEYTPPSGNQDEEYIELQNPNAVAVDLSGWQLAGGVTFTFLPGTIIEANGKLYVSPKVAAFRARPGRPSGGSGLNVEGDYPGQISARGETISLLDPTATTIDTLTTPSTPSAQQKSLRITELHYAPPGGRPFEFIELKNIGSTPLDLTGVHFSNGVTFNFTGGSLAPGAYGILVTDPANFPGLNVLGTYSGSLNNGGEQLTLRDSAGENILSFEFDGDWFPPARGAGYSIDIFDDRADWSTWDLLSSWALSCNLHGSPGEANPEPHSNAYRSWSAQFFTPTELADPLISAAESDASGDGVPNLIKYALGLDPTIPTLDGLPVVDTASGFLALSFQRLAKTADLSQVVEVSTDLKAWSTLTTEATIVDNGDGTERVTLRSETSLSAHLRQFIRLRVTQN